MNRQERFWRRVNKTGPIVRPEFGACWIWTGEGDGFGYGRFYWARRRIAAHRASWRLEYGEIPTGLVICHRCDNGLCVRPEHLFIGTQADNIADMVAKGRHYEARKTHCDNGHEFNQANTYVRPDGARKCRACARRISNASRGGERPSSTSPTPALNQSETP